MLCILYVIKTLCEPPSENVNIAIEEQTTDLLTASRSFSSGPRVGSRLELKPLGPKLAAYKIGLSSGQSSSSGKPITLTGKAEAVNFDN